MIEHKTGEHERGGERMGREDCAIFCVSGLCWVVLGFCVGARDWEGEAVACHHALPLHKQPYYRSYREGKLQVVAGSGMLSLPPVTLSQVPPRVE